MRKIAIILTIPLAVTGILPNMALAKTMYDNHMECRVGQRSR